MDTPLVKSTEQLFATIMERDIKQIQKLMEEGLHVNLADETGCTLVHLAAFNNKKEIVEFLFEKGANICTVDKEGFTLLHSALHFAVQIDDKVIVELLLKGGADINTVDKEGFTPLHYAIHHGYKEVIERLSTGSKY